VAESAAWLAAALAYSAVWMALARHLVGAHTAPQVQTGLEKPGGGVSVTAVAASLGLIVLAPLFEEVAFRGFLLDRVRRWFMRLVSSRCTQTRRPNESNESGNTSEATHALSPRAARVAADGAAVVVTAVVWALAHGGRVEPEWVKWVQIFGLGLALGVLRLRRGLEACVVVHLLFNFPGGFLFASS
jgi:membrane protease YdiL (CAAX protease family)